jgi:hypothetical protein
MPARSLAAKTSAAFIVLFVTLLLLPLSQGCNATCSASSDCSGGDVCLYSAGSGCSAAGHCGLRESCVAQPTPTSLCSCWSGESLNLFCVPPDGIAEPTTNGGCAGSPTDAGGASDAGAAVDGEATDGAATAADASGDAGAIADAGGQ